MPASMNAYKVSISATVTPFAMPVFLGKTGTSFTRPPISMKKNVASRQGVQWWQPLLT